MSPLFIVCPLLSPRTSFNKVGEYLIFKWLPLRLRSPLGVRLFPTEPQSRRASVCSALHAARETRHSSLLNPGRRDRSAQGDRVSTPTSDHGRFRRVTCLLQLWELRWFILQSLQTCLHRTHLSVFSSCPGTYSLMSFFIIINVIYIGRGREN